MFPPKAFSVSCEVQPQGLNGVILAQGGRQNGYVLHLVDGRLIFGVRQQGKLFTVESPAVPQGRFSLEARLKADGGMLLFVNSKQVGQGKAAGLIPVQPSDPLTVGEDTITAVGNYNLPNKLQGLVEKVQVVVD